MTFDIGYLSFPWKASLRDRDLSSTELKRGYRVIGGDKGDVRFRGYDVDEAGTELVGVTLLSHVAVTANAREIAEQVVSEAFDSIGVECVEHS